MKKHGKVVVVYTTPLLCVAKLKRLLLIHTQTHLRSLNYLNHQIKAVHIGEATHELLLMICDSDVNDETKTGGDVRYVISSSLQSRV